VLPNRVQILVLAPFLGIFPEPVVGTIFLEKRVKEKQPMGIECNQPIEEREGWSIELADGQGGSSLLVGPAGQTDRPMGDQRIDRWSTRGSADGRKMAIIKEVRQKESTVEAGQSTIGNGSKSQF
jgi:hypothetical protein